MSIERKRRILEILDEALEVPTAERPAYLDTHCDDPEIRREVEELLATEIHDEVLSEPAFDVHAEDAAVGRRVGSYEIVRLLERGGMGSVYLAEREDFDQRVALKLLRRGLDLDETLVRRFHNERQILAHLDHANIAKLLDGGTTEDRLPYFVMEFVDGVPVDRYCAEHELSIGERLQLFRKVCSAVQFAHRNLVVHRDLKPSNVLITEDGEPKLLDFGIAKLLDHGMAAMTLDTMPGHGAMTPRYASPEQIRLDPVTTASDVYSLGVLLYELLTGRTPYRLESDRSDEVARAVCEQEPDKPSTAVRRRAAESSGETMHDPRRLKQLLVGDLDSIVLKALRKRPENRYESVEQFSEDVQRYLTGLPVQAREGTGFYRFGKFVRRNWAALAVVSLFVVMAITFAMVSWNLRQDSLKAQELAETRLDWMKWILLGADPNTSNAKERTALELLRLARRSTPEEVGISPEGQIDLLGMIGELFRDLGELEDAKSVMAEVLEIAKDHYGPDHGEVAKRLGNLGVVLDDLGEHDRADQSFREALKIRERLGQDIGELFRLQSNMANTQMLQGKLRHAEAIHLRVLRERETRYGVADTDVATSLRNLGAVYFAMEDPKAAEPLLERSLNIRRQSYGSRHTSVASVLDLLGRVKAALRSNVDAERLFIEALEIRLQRLGENHYAVAQTWTNLGALLIEEDSERAARYLQQAIDRMNRVDPGGRELAEAESAYGELLTSRSECEEAESYLIRSFDRLMELRGPKSVSTRETHHRIVNFYETCDRPEDLAAFLSDHPKINHKISLN